MAPPEDNDDESDEPTRAHDRAGLARMTAGPRTQAPYFIVVSGAISVGRMFKLEKEMLIGRTSSADIWLDDDGVSRRHALVTVDAAGEVLIADLGSRNGIFYEGERVSRHVLQDGDKIQVGSATILKFSYQDSLDEALQRNLYESAVRDGLTRAHNKRHFADVLRKEFAYSERHGTPLSLLMIDVDRFKSINDTYGHLAGDHVLQRIASLIAETIRVEDTLARYGGEEFALLLRQTPREAAWICAERVRSVIENAAFSHERAAIAVTVSIGVATGAGARYAVPDEIVAAADRALYEAKARGRNRVISADDLTP